VAAALAAVAGAAVTAAAVAAVTISPRLSAIPQQPVLTAPRATQVWSRR
jgi:hypothetical protein